MVKTLYFTPGEYAVELGQLVRHFVVPTNTTLLGWCVDMFGNISMRVEVPDSVSDVENVDSEG